MKYIVALSFVFSALLTHSQTQIDFYTTEGDFRVEVREDLMPITAGNFIDLVKKKFYDGVIFHRVVRNFVVQGGDPTGTGFGGPGYTIMDEYHPDMNHDSTGVMAMAKTTAPNSAGSQFYFTLGAQNRLDRNYAVFGSCIQNVEIIENIGLVAVNGNNRPLEDVVMDSVRIVQNTSGQNDLDGLVVAEVFPNPFVEEVQISYKVKTAGEVEVAIYDIHGRSIKSLTKGYSPSGTYNLVWNGRTGCGENAAIGTYYVTFVTPSSVASRKVFKGTL